VFLMLVTGKPPARGGGGMPQRIIASSRSLPELRTAGAGVVRENARHRRQVATYRKSARIAS
jgi:hypothetical protein